MSTNIIIAFGGVAIDREGRSTHTNAQLTAEAGGELADLAGQLQRLVGRFRV